MYIYIYRHITNLKYIHNIIDHLDQVKVQSIIFSKVCIVDSRLEYHSLTNMYTTLTNMYTTLTNMYTALTNMYTTLTNMYTTLTICIQHWPICIQQWPICVQQWPICIQHWQYVYNTDNMYTTVTNMYTTVTNMYTTLTNMYTTVSIKDIIYLYILLLCSSPCNVSLCLWPWAVYALCLINLHSFLDYSVLTIHCPVCRSQVGACPLQSHATHTPRNG